MLFKLFQSHIILRVSLKIHDIKSVIKMNSIFKSSVFLYKRAISEQTNLSLLLSIEFVFNTIFEMICFFYIRKIKPHYMILRVKKFSLFKILNLLLNLFRGLDEWMNWIKFQTLEKIYRAFLIQSGLISWLRFLFQFQFLFQL